MGMGPSPAWSSPELRVSEAPNAVDSTQYVNIEDGGMRQLIRELKKPEDSKSVDCRALVRHDRWGRPLYGRIIACRCFQGKQWSVTIRLEEDPPPGPPVFVGQPSLDSNFKPSEDAGPYFCSRHAGCTLLFEQIFEAPQRTGLIVVAGATASGKSEITRGLIFQRMKRDAGSARTPHLITFEDPIEKFYLRGPNNEYCQPHFNYTPREKGLDACDLRSVLNDALRQTPTLVFVGEVRDSREWIDLVDFAGTGHSVVATAHAGSLAEAWGKILSAIQARTPAQRSDVADKVLAIVHLRSLPGFKGSFPALWRYTPPGAKCLMADGRSALLPNHNVHLQDDASFGRLWFAERIVGRGQGVLSAQLKQALFRSDLEGI